MLLETRINDRATLVIDAEAVGGIDKSSTSINSNPDKVMSAAMAAIRAVAENVGEAGLVDATTPPSEMEVSFTVRVDSNSTVSIARSPDAGQLRVTLRWQFGPSR